MKRLMGLVLAGILATSVGAMAHDMSCCGEGKGKVGVCADACAKLHLTDKQKGQVTALKAQCNNATSTSEARQQFAEGMEKILTADQLAQWQDQCKQMDKGSKEGSGCPFMKHKS